MPRDNQDYLRHILDECKYLLQISEGLEEEDFYQNDTLKRAVTRSLEIIGEAAKNVTPDFKEKYNRVEWKSMTGMRDRLIHGYHGVNYILVWDVVKSKIPILHEQISKALNP